MKDKALRCYAVAAPGLEPLVVAELTALGIPARAETGGAAWEGDIASVYRANLWLRTATRVLVRVARFRATTFWELERRASDVAWSSVVRPGATVAFRVTAKKSKLYHSDAVAERLAASVMAAVHGVRVVDLGPGADDDGDGEAVDAAGAAMPVVPALQAPVTPVQLFVVRLSRDELTLSADSSGAPLYRRGYRQAVAKAPLRETLAAALLMASGWTPGEPLLDPFCGSGTIPLEAALMAGGIAPGIASSTREARAFGFTGWPGFNAALWLECVNDARSMASKVSMDGQATRIRGSDRDAGAIRAAESNAARAGLSAAVEFTTAPVSALVPPEGNPGWIATNPPYGMRVGEGLDVRHLYAAFGRAIRERAAGWQLGMFSPDPRLEGIVASEAGLRLEEKVRTRNGGIPVRIVAGG